MEIRRCHECYAGEKNELAVMLVEHPNPNHRNLMIRKWVCEDHYFMLADDYPEIRTLKGREGEDF